MSLPEQTPEQVELFWTYNTPNVAMMSIAMFLMMSRVHIPESSRTAKWLASLTTCGFGMYMIHYYFVYLGYEAGIWLHIPAPLRIPFSALIILICSWSIVALAKKMFGDKTKYLLG
jgi:surface polysaccharide O-acyltransferase-like enzyme